MLASHALPAITTVHTYLEEADNCGSPGDDMAKCGVNPSLTIPDPMIRLSRLTHTHTTPVLSSRARTGTRRIPIRRDRGLSSAVVFGSRLGSGTWGRGRGKDACGVTKGEDLNGEKRRLQSGQTVHRRKRHLEWHATPYNPLRINICVQLADTHIHIFIYIYVYIGRERDTGTRRISVPLFTHPVRLWRWT
jgi:hypothetical protein